MSRGLWRSLPYCKSVERLPILSAWFSSLQTKMPASMAGVAMLVLMNVEVIYAVPGYQCLCGDR